MWSTFDAIRTWIDENKDMFIIPDLSEEVDISRKNKLISPINPLTTNKIRL